MARVVRPVTGECKLLEAPLDPIADFPVRKVVSFEYAELSSSQRGEVVGRVPAEWLEPYTHQRYDDLSVLGATVMIDVPGGGSDRYVVVSADGHAGLACEEYRQYLDPKYFPAFDDYLAERMAHREESLAFNYDYIMGWEKDNEEG